MTRAKSEADITPTCAMKRRVFAHPEVDVLLIVALGEAETALDDLLDTLGEVGVHAGVTVRHGLVAAGSGQARGLLSRGSARTTAPRRPR